MTAARDPEPLRISRTAMAKREHLKTIGREFLEPEPDVIVVVRWTGERDRWVKRIGTEFFELVGEAA